MKALIASGPTRGAVMIVTGSLLLASSTLHAAVIGVSPGAAERFVRLTTVCPTFSWTREGDAAYELEIYRAEREGPDVGAPILRQALPAGATSWTPAEEACLDAGGRYAWSVRAVNAQDGREASPWSELMLFEVSATQGALPSGAAGLSVESDDPDGTAAAFISDVGGRLISGQALGDEVFSVDAGGDVVANSFTGDGSGLSKVLTAGQGCAPGFFLSGLDADGQPICGPPFLITVVDESGNDVGRDNSIAIGLDGNPVISYYDLTAGALRVAKCNDPACTGGGETITTVDDTANIEGEWPSIAVGNDGNPVISYWDRTAEALKVAKCNDTDCAGMDETITTIDDPASRAGEYNSIAIGNDGNPVISYYDFAGVGDGRLKVAKCNDPACAGTDETITTVDDPATDVGRWTSIAIGNDGNPVMSYFDNNLGALLVAKCNDPDCSGMDETISTVDDPANVVGEYSSIAIGLDGNPVIGYYDSTADSLKVAKCNDPACAGLDETITTIDNGGNDVGRYTSLAIGFDGNPVISYNYTTADALRVAKCNDPACAGMDETITTVDDPADTGLGGFTSIAIGADGNPVISYYDFFDDVLKVAKCANPDCAP